jgi:restriction endonuclease S subunit
MTDFPLENMQHKIKDLDKSHWKYFRFEDIAFNITERVEPLDTNLDVYVGLEHIEPESLHIKRFGKKEDVEGTKLRFYPGDIIFGRRRAYQRKAAIAPCDGFCSAHAMVLRANPEVIDLRLFPFFLHSDSFMHRAVDISVGSLSPTINWGTLKDQEFLLTPKDQQAKIAELLWNCYYVAVELAKQQVYLR